MKRPPIPHRLKSTHRHWPLINELIFFLFKKKSAHFTRLSGGIFFTHAIANSLASIILNLEVLEQSTDLASNTYFHQALANSLHLKNMISDRIFQERFSLKQSITEALSLVSQEQVCLVKRLSGRENDTLRGNKHYFQEAVVCAVNNAVESYDQQKRNKIVLITAAPTSKNWVVSIIDGGRGMGWWRKQVLFLPGLSQKSTGMGVGLCWIKFVVEDMLNGKIIMASKKDQGTTLQWVIPRC